MSGARIQLYWSPSVPTVDLRHVKCRRWARSVQDPGSKWMAFGIATAVLGHVCFDSLWGEADDGCACTTSGVRQSRPLLRGVSGDGSREKEPAVRRRDQGA